MIKNLSLFVTVIMLLVAIPAISSAQTTKTTTIDAIRDAQTKAGSVREALTSIQNSTPGLLESMSRIDALSDKKGDLPASIDAAKQLAKAARDSVMSANNELTRSLEQQRMLDSHLDSAFTAIQASQNNESPLKQIDNALTPNIATNLAAASLTLAGLLLGLGMPLLVSQAALSKTQGADKMTERFRIEVARAGVYALRAFACFAVAILDNITVGPGDWAFISALKANTRLWFDVGTEVTALVAGIAFLLMAGRRLIVQVNHLVRVWAAVTRELPE